MANWTDKFKINLNQNLWGLLVAMGGLGAAEYFELPKLLLISSVLAWAMLGSVLLTSLAYTLEYGSRRLFRMCRLCKKGKTDK